MASLKLSVSLGNNSCEPKKLKFPLESLRLSDISPFSGCLNIYGTFFLNPFCKLKHIRVSKLIAEVSDPSESNLVDNLVDVLSKEEGFATNSVVERSDFNGDSDNRKVNIWKKFRQVKQLKKGTKPRPNFQRNVNKIKKPEKPVLVHRARDRDVMMDSEDLVDFNADDFEPDMSLERCNVILKQLEKVSETRALRFIEWMRENGKFKQNVTAYNLVLRVLGRRGDWEDAEAVIREMINVSHCELNCQVFNTLIYACYKQGVVALGSRWFRMMLENGIQPNVATFGMLMSLYQKGLAVEAAEFTFSYMRSLRIVCQSAYSAMITIYIRMGLYDKAERVIGFLSEDKVPFNLENWLVLLNAYCQQGKLNEAEQALISMRKDGFRPNIIAYNTMITGYGRMSIMDGAERLFRNLQSIGLEPDETTYRSMIEGWGRADSYQDAMRYYMELKRLGFKPNSSNLFTIINLQAKHNDEEGAGQTIVDMLTIGCPKSSVLGIVMQAYEKVSRLDKVPLFLRGSLYDHVLRNQTSCSTLVISYVKNSMIDDVLKVLREKLWEDPAFEDNLYHLLICLCKDLGHHENAVKVFTRMPKSDEPNLQISCTMIDIYSKMEMFIEAENLYLELKTVGVKLDMIALSIVVRMYVKAGSIKDACLVLDIVEKENIVPDVYLLRDMLRIYQRCGKHDKLADLYYKILKDGVIWDQEMYNCVINCCAHALPVDELSRLFDEMLKLGFAPNSITLNVMLDAYGKSKLFKKARKVFWLAKKQGMADVVSYNILVAAYGQNKYLKNMSSTVRKMQFDGFSVSLEAYNCMLDAYGKEGEMEKFRDVLLRMRDSNCASDHYTYNIMINIYGEQGWIEEVAEVLKELKESGIRPDLCGYNTLIKAYGIAGMVEHAVDMIKEMRQNGIDPDRITYINLITALRKNDKFLEAVKWSLWMKQMGL